MHIQKIFVILAFNNQLMEKVISLLVQIPVIGDKLEAPVRTLLGIDKHSLLAHIKSSRLIFTFQPSRKKS